MDKQYTSTVIRIVNQLPGITCKITAKDRDLNLQQIGVNSIRFVFLIVQLEDKFSIQFPREKLFVTQTDTVAKICEMIAEEVEKCKTN